MIVLSSKNTHVNELQYQNNIKAVKMYELVDTKKVVIKFIYESNVFLARNTFHGFDHRVILSIKNSIKQLFCMNCQNKLF